MWRRRALFQQNKMLLATALLGAHASHSENGFRQRDLRFFFELCHVWAQEFLHDEEPAVANTQFARVLKQFVSSGLARVVPKANVPRYLLTRAGLLDCLNTVVHEVSPSHIEEALFAGYFLKNYRETIKTLVKNSAKEFPSAVAVEIHALLDLAEFKRNLLRRLDRKISRLRDYTRRCIQASEQSKKMLAKGANLEDIVGFLHEFNPYQLNSQKPLRDLYPEIPPSIVEWELTEGAKTRATEIWKPLLETLERYRRLIELL